MSKKNTTAPASTIARITEDEASEKGYLTVKAAVSEFNISALTVGKRIKLTSLAPAALIVTGSRGRPTRAFTREDLVPLLVNTVGNGAGRPLGRATKHSDLIPQADD